MGEVRKRVPPGLIFGNSPFEISAADFRGKTISERVQVHRGSLRRQPRPNGFTRHRWSRQRQPSVPFCRPHPIRFPSSLWGTMASAEPTRTNYAQSTFGIGSKADWAMQTLLVASSWLVVKSDVSTIRLVHTCTLRTWTSLSISTATISRSESSSRMGDRSRVWRRQPDAEGGESISVGHRQSECASQLPGPLSRVSTKGGSSRACPLYRRRVPIGV
jgi:hypothetical protein